MAQYITLARCDHMIDAAGENAGWRTYSDAERLSYIIRASDRIEALPFKLDGVGQDSSKNTSGGYSARPRFNQGFFSAFDSSGGLESPPPPSEPFRAEHVPADIEYATSS